MDVGSYKEKQKKKQNSVTKCGLPLSFKMFLLVTFICCSLVFAFLEQEHKCLGRLPCAVVINSGN